MRSKSTSSTDAPLRTKDIGHELAETVDDGRMPLKIADALNQTKRFDDSRHSIKAAEFDPEASEH